MNVATTTPVSPPLPSPPAPQRSLPPTLAFAVKVGICTHAEFAVYTDAELAELEESLHSCPAMLRVAALRPTNFPAASPPAPHRRPRSPSTSPSISTPDRDLAAEHAAIEDFFTAHATPGTPAHVRRASEARLTELALIAMPPPHSPPPSAAASTTM